VELDNDRLMVHFTTGDGEDCIWECMPPKENINESYPASFRRCLQKHSSIHYETFMFDLSECNANNIGEINWEQLDIKEPESVVCPVWDYSDCWIYHSKHKNADGEHALCLLSHESATITQKPDCNVGTLFLLHWAEFFDIGTPKINYLKWKDKGDLIEKARDKLTDHIRLWYYDKVTPDYEDKIAAFLLNIGKEYPMAVYIDTFFLVRMQNAVERCENLPLAAEWAFLQFTMKFSSRLPRAWEVSQESVNRLLTRDADKFKDWITQSANKDWVRRLLEDALMYCRPHHSPETMQWLRNALRQCNGKSVEALQKWEIYNVLKNSLSTDLAYQTGVLADKMFFSIAEEIKNLPAPFDLSKEIKNGWNTTSWSQSIRYAIERRKHIAKYFVELFPYLKMRPEDMDAIRKIALKFEKIPLAKLYQVMDSNWSDEDKERIKNTAEEDFSVIDQWGDTLTGVYSLEEQEYEGTAWLIILIGYHYHLNGIEKTQNELIEIIGNVRTLE
jgi:hypothetical protein